LRIIRVVTWNANDRCGQVRIRNPAPSDVDLHSLAYQRLRNATPDAATATGDKCYFIGPHESHRSVS